MKNIMDASLGAIAFFTVGWALAWGKSAGGAGLVGWSEFFLIGCKDLYQVMWNFSFAATASTIDSGAVAERMNFSAYLIVSACITGFIYPIVSHWVWSDEGWLSKRGYFDFAGSGAVHTLGGVLALVSSIWIGPRVGRIRPAHNEILATIDVRAKVKLHVQGSVGDDGGGGGRRKYKLRVSFRARNECTKAVESGEDGTFPPLTLPAHWDLRSVLHSGDALVVEVLKCGEEEEDDDDPVAFVKNGGEVFATAMMPLVKKSKSDAAAGPLGLHDDDDSDAEDAEGAEYFTEDDESESVSIRTTRALSRVMSSSGRQNKYKKDGESGKRGSSESRKTTKNTFSGVGFDNSVTRVVRAMASTVGLVKPEVTSRYVFSSSDECATNSWREDLPAHVPAYRKAKWCLPMKRKGAKVGFVQMKVKYCLKTALYDRKVSIELSSPINMLYGAFVLWMGWYGFNSASVGPVTQGRDITVAHVVVNTTIGACSGIVAAIAYTFPRCGYYDVTATACGMLGGLVSITGCANVVDEWAALVIGGLGGVMTIASLGFLEFFSVDDACGAVAVHFTCGVWSMIATGLFHSGIRISHFKCLNPESEWHPQMCMYHCDGPDFVARGLFYGGGWDLLWVQCYGTLVISLWSCLSSLVILWSVENILKIPCRVTLKTEMLGLDVVEHGYDINAKMVAALQSSDIAMKIKTMASRKTYDEVKRQIVRQNWKAAIMKVLSMQRASNAVSTAFKGHGGYPRVSSGATAAGHTSDKASASADGRHREELSSLREEVQALRDMIKMLVNDKIREEGGDGDFDDFDHGGEVDDRVQLGPNSLPRRGARATEKDWDARAAWKKRALDKMRMINMGLILARGGGTLMS